MFEPAILQQITVNVHSSICIRREKVIYVDPLYIGDEPHDADLILITHPHYDHFSPADIKRVMGENTVIAVPASMAALCRKKLGKEPVAVTPAQSLNLCGIPVETIAAYNTMKFFHLKKLGWVGYVLTLGDTRVYITGDTDDTPECRAVSCDVLLLPIGGIYTIDAKQAAALTNQIHPHTVIPVHYGKIIGGEKAPEVFRVQVAGDIETDIRKEVFSTVVLDKLLVLAAIAICGCILGFFLGRSL